MERRKALLVFSALPCLLFAMSVRMSAQQQEPKSPASKPKVSTAPSTAPSAQRILESACRNYFLKPADELRSDYQVLLDSELQFRIGQARQCAIQSIKPSLRAAAFRAYEVLRDEQAVRSFRTVDAAWDKAWTEQKDKLQAQQEEMEKLRAHFAEAANFAIALFKEYQQYKEAYEEETRFYDNLRERYRETYDLAVEAINLAIRSPRSSLPAFYNAPAPQVIRIETPEVPRSLHCTANTIPPAAPGLSTWTWTDCHW